VAHSVLLLVVIMAVAFSIGKPDSKKGVAKDAQGK